MYRNDEADPREINDESEINKLRLFKEPGIHWSLHNNMIVQRYLQ